MRHAVTSFTAGEISPLVHGRADLEALKSAAVRMRNMIPIGLGPAMQRPGTLYCGRAYNEGYPVRLVGYTYSRGVTYQIEFGNYYVRFWKDNAVVGSVLATPWSAAEIFDLKFTSANDVVWVCHRSHWPRRLIRVSATDWQIEEFAVIFPPLRDMNARSITVTPSATTGAISLTASADVFAAGDVGGYYGISHRRDLPIVELNLGLGSASASAVLTVTNHPADGQAVSIGGKVYTGKTTPEAAYEFARGAAAANWGENLIKIINGETAGTPANPDVTADNGGTVATGTYATATLTIANQPGVGVTVVVDTVTVTAVSGSPGANQFQIGATKEDTLDNIVTALNASLTTAAMQARIGNQAVCRATTAGTAGNSIALSESSTWLSWSSATLTGGVDSNTERVTVTAIAPGEAGNGIVLGETLSSGSWSSAATQGGVSLALTSDPITVLGDCEVFTYGRWNGQLFLEIEREPGIWLTLRAWKSTNDFNAQSTVTIDDGKRVRLRYAGTGTEADSAFPRAMLSALDAFVTGVVKITAVADARNASADVVKELYSTAATYDWSEGAWSARRGYPSAVALHEQRLCFGRDVTLWGSQISGFDNFERSTLEDAAFAYDLAAGQGNEIQSIVSHRGLIILTDGDEWLMDGGPQSSSITASKVRAERKSGYGSASVAPVLLASSVLFVESGKRRLNEYVFDFASEGYEAVDLSELAEHLTSEKIAGMAWAPNPHNVLWLVTESGSLLSMTYRRKAGMIAWAKHSTPGGVFESVCTVPGADGITEVWFSIRRGTVRTIERFDPEHWSKLQGDDKAALCCADGAVVGSGSSVSGLGHLEGMSVGVLADGAVETGRIVTGGSVTIDSNPASAVVGLPVAVELAVMPALFMLQTGTSFGKQYRVASMAVRFYQSGAGTYADADSATHYPLSFRKATDPTGVAAPLYTGQQRLDNSGSWTDSTTVVFKNQSMLPLNVTALVLETSVQ